jgi:hypothetical protein
VTGSRTRFGLGILVVALVAAALSGCGSDDEPSASEDSSTTTGQSSSLDGWARGLCTTVATWQASIKSTNMARSQTDFAEASETITEANGILNSSLEGLGTPPEPATSEAANAIDDLEAKLEESAGEIEQALTGVNTQAEIVTATSRTKNQISEMNSDISATVTELKALPDEQGWKEAFEGVPACQAVAR